MGVYEEQIVPIKISRLAEYVSRRKRISLDEALVYEASRNDQSDNHPRHSASAGQEPGDQSGLLPVHIFPSNRCRTRTLRLLCS